MNISMGNFSSVAGDTSKMGKTHLTRFRKERSMGSIAVPCKPLLRLYEDAMTASTSLQRSARLGTTERGWKRGSPVTYLSLDVEGSELDVLESVPNLDQQPFEVILVENEYNNLRDRLVKKLLLTSGYHQFLMPQPSHGGTNELYVSNALKPIATQLLGNRTERWKGRFAPHNPEADLKERIRILMGAKPGIAERKV